MYLNRVELIGLLGSEPEANFTPNGKAVTSLSFAIGTTPCSIGR
jgi:single-stranded DNA-binding protein